MDSTLSQSSPQSPTLVVVLGMHRSGTSVATRALETLGASFGSNLIKPAVGVNPKGFFEDVDVVTLDVDLMNATGVDWFALPAADFSRLDTAQLDEFRSRALTLLREKCASGIFALKDPRICRLLPFWQSVFEQIDARVLYVVAFRHPISVAHSLATRDSLAPEQSYLLWLAHVAAALRHTSGLPRALVNYDTMMETPRSELARLSVELGLPLDPVRAETFEREFLEDGLRHTRFNDEDLKRIDNAPNVMKSLFNALETFTNVSSPEHCHRLDEALDRAEAYLAENALLFALGWKFEQGLGLARQRIDELDVAISAKEVRAVEFEQGLAQADSRISLLEQELRAAQMRISELEQARHAEKAHFDELEHVRQTAHSHIETLEQRCRAMEAAGTAQQREFDQAVTTLNHILNSTSWRVTAPLRAVRRRFSA